MFALMFICALWSFTNESIAISRYAYLIMTAFSALLFLLNYYKGKNSTGTNSVFISLFVIGAYFFGIINGTVIDPYTPSLTIMVFIVSIPLLFNGPPIIRIAELLGAGVVFLLFAFAYKQPEVVSSDIVDLATFGIYSIVILIAASSIKARGCLARVEAVQAQNELNRKVETINLLHEAMSSGSWYATFNENAEMTSCILSDSFRKMIGYESEEEFPNLLESWSERLHPEDRDRVLKEFWDTVYDYTGAKTYDVTYRLMTRKQGYRYFRSCGRLARREDGSPIEYQGMFMDIDDTVKKAAEDANRANIAKTNFLFNMSHDIRTPMNAIMGYTRMAKKSINNPETVSMYLDKTDISSKQLLGLINQVLEMSRIESGKVVLSEEKTDIIERAHAMKTIAETEAECKGLKFSMNIGDIKHKYVLTDASRMNQIMTNILGNATKYTPEGGSVTYTVEEIDSNRPGYAVYRFTVADTGIGMSEEYLGHVFEEFTRENSSTVSSIQGSGLGMSIVKKLVDLMGGNIDVKSKKNEGTTITVTVPMLIDPDAEGSEAAEEEIEYRDVTFTHKRLLLVEDNEMNREIARDILEDAGFIVETAEDGDIAVEMVKATAERGDSEYYDAVLMDIQMPRMNGYEATKAIRALPDPQNTHMPIIAVSANAFEEDRRKSFEAGMDDHVSKPIDIQKLKETLAKYL